MASRVVNIVIEQGTNFNNTYLVENSNNSPQNLTGYTGVAKISKHPGSATKTNFSVNIVGSSGIVSIALTSGATTSLKPGRYVYDVVLSDASNVKTRIVEGTALVTAGVCT